MNFDNIIIKILFYFLVYGLFMVLNSSFHFLFITKNLIDYLDMRLLHVDIVFMD